ncbi:anti-sigma factor [Glycomyces terrestris]|uniref:Regulator of SigK n=1 Tax=Glycomyces terrestris TaxID=2493553 RepID=A0A426V305_9ACTN|nr:anti-sigma factor [Glycomyces terrestris]RRS01283.1 anti-sigma factor [Glycomyces terrestris]
MSDDVHSLIGAWAVDAVDDDERRRVEAHLLECESCAAEAVELREAAGRLSDVLLTDPPPELRDRVLAATSRTGQEAAPAPRRRPARRPGTLRVPRRRLALGAAALALAAAFAGVFATWQVMRSTDAPLAESEMAAVLEAPDADVAVQRAEGGGRVTVVFSAELDQAVVVVSDLAEIGDDRSYQVWLVDEAGQTSAGVMDPGDSSATMLVDGLGDTEIVGLTNEPAGGSDQPTEPMIADLALPA